MIDIMELDDTKELVRDVHSKALLAVNNTKLREHQLKRDSARMVTKNAEDISMLKNEMSEIKNLLQILVNK
jgi:hypothetical protein